jgi:hypothetical protein
MCIRVLCGIHEREEGKMDGGIGVIFGHFLAFLFDFWFLISGAEWERFWICESFSVMLCLSLIILVSLASEIPGWEFSGIKSKQCV